MKPNRSRNGLGNNPALVVAPIKVKCFHLSAAVRTEIGKRALDARERLHLLTGEAAGEQVALVEREDPAVLLRDLLDAIPTSAPARTARDQGVAWLHALEEDLEPDRAPGWLTSELKARGVLVVNQLHRRVDGESVNRPAVTVAAVRRVLEGLDSAVDGAE